MTVMIERGPICQCGCGEYLPIGSIRSYKRGHKERANRELADTMAASNGVFDGYNFRQLPYNAEPIDTNYSPDGDWETIQQVADRVPNDPEGDPWAKDEKNDFGFSQTFATPSRTIVKDIEGKIAFMLSTAGMALGMPDPICGNALLENTPNITKALTPIICQSPAVVAWFQKTSNFMLYVNLLMACAPFAATVLNHHFPPKHQVPNTSAPIQSDAQFTYGVS